MLIRECVQNNFIAVTSHEFIKNVHKIAMDQRATYIVVKEKNRIRDIFTIWELIEAYSSCPNGTMDNIKSKENFAVLSDQDNVTTLSRLDQNMAVVVDREQQPVGVIDGLKILKKLAAPALFEHGNLEKDEYASVLHHLGEEVLIVDGGGIVLYLNPAAETVNGVKEKDLLGKHVRDLEKENIISTSISLMVYQKKEKVDMMQHLKSGKTVLATAVPTFDEQGNIKRVICTSKDVDEINSLKSKVENQSREIIEKNQQIDKMREALFRQTEFVCSHEQLEEIKEKFLKIANTDLTVLIQGESGVGKEVVVRLLHNLSARSKYPLIKINCGLIPENLIESELFGYESGAFTGANKNGKLGKIELAHNSTLFLDEIGEMPLLLQVKLLEFLQDRKITRIGGTKRIEIDTRVIAATNRDLHDMVIKGTFRKDLYYRLNVFPLHIAPLRDRKDDIPVFLEYFLGKFNDKYKFNKKITPEVFEELINYYWPGNVRELEHTVEKAIINSDSDLITKEDFNLLPAVEGETRGRVICTGLMPWKSAKRELEVHLVKKAYDLYKSTYKAADALDVSQSTVAKILKNLNK
ncbi:sigma 54-interacting transcriptional regulator [Dehalobacterium formicoaceticum]|uniref:Sigma 54-interacting transcriptional regulator n=1 Tax=Dehalobacterium formicoaceticum TaxID=51515 RepID=A0ABT1Y608_9FIRM|nr:sigma 54-interacting transcriptional regulator [Dehalobacterium formicoaceticum]MCR6546320.1 sigma 54-interacting transcriptional regulator [Dehalobacterium formicoaceticum]